MLLILLWYDHDIIDIFQDIIDIIFISLLLYYWYVIMIS